MGKSQRAMFESCYAEWDGQMLAVGNGYIRRQWRVENGLLYAASLRDKISGREWLAGPSTQPAPYPNAVLPDEARQVRFKAFEKRDMPVEAPSLAAELRAEGASTTLVYRFQVFPEAAGITGQLIVEGDFPDPGEAGDRTRVPAAGVELADAGRPQEKIPALDILEVLSLSPQHLRLTQVRLRRWSVYGRRTGSGCTEGGSSRSARFRTGRRGQGSPRQEGTDRTDIC